MSPLPVGISVPMEEEIADQRAGGLGCGNNESGFDENFQKKFLFLKLSPLLLRCARSVQGIHTCVNG